MTHPSDRTGPPPGGGEPSRLEEMLGSRPLTAVEWGLDRTRRMLERLGRPQDTFRSIHVGGTNGKGSAAAMMASVLREDGRRTGLYTSPELLEMPDRYRVQGVPLDRRFLSACAARVGPLAEETDATFFEAATALAFLAFREAGVEWAAVEVGLGGRLDATNVLEPVACAVTSVALDHTEYLGETLEAVAGEQAGIWKPAVPAVLGPVPDPCLSVFRDRAREVGAPLLRLGRHATVEEVRVDGGGTSFRYRSPGVAGGRRFRIPLPGAHQAANAGVALLTLEQLEDPPSPVAMERGLREVRWRGRFQHVAGPGGGWILDAAHNEAAIRTLTGTLDRVAPPRPVVVLAAALGDRDPRMLRPLLERADGVVLTVAPSAPAERRWELEGAAERIGALSAVRTEPRFGAAMAAARELAGEGTVVVTGSCYTVGDALRWLAAADADVDGEEAPAAGAPPEALASIPDEEEEAP
jgi:dihydrofolate synthase/folylpolyglutamate synthase